VSHSSLDGLFERLRGDGSWVKPNSAKAATGDRQQRVATRLWTAILSASGRSRPIADIRRLQLPSGLQSFAQWAVHDASQPIF
jgi:hypothetical protein